jgi:hypothetical protein
MASVCRLVKESGRPKETGEQGVVLKKLGFNEPLKPNFLIPANFSHRTLNGRNPQILAKGF